MIVSVYTMEPRLTATHLLYDHLVITTIFLDPNIIITESFYYFEDPVNVTTSLLRPGVNLIKNLQVQKTSVLLFKSLKTIATLSCKLHF